MSAALRSRVTRAAIRARAAWHYRVLRRRVIHYRPRQVALAERYGVEGHDPEPYGEATRQRILRVAARMREPVEYVWTSGTTQTPKQLLYPRSRTRTLQAIYLEQVLLAFDALALDRLATYQLVNLAPDRSLSSLLARQPLPWYVRRIAPAGSIAHLPPARALLGRCSAEALHVSLMVLGAPLMIATVNPSSLSVLLDHVRGGWDEIRVELGRIVRSDLVPEVRRRLGQTVEHRVARLQALADRSDPPSVPDLLPELRAVYCWDGGYVQPFIDRLRAQLAPLSPVFVPLFSLSTETVAYEIFPRLTPAGGLPVYPGVCYEFLPLEVRAEAAAVLKPWELESGRSYVMLVSDAYGLRRYLTGDVFTTLGFERSVPVLRFRGRSGVTYSFTGEKVTAEQLLVVYERLRAEHGAPGVAFASFPRLNRAGVPGYVLACCPGADGTLRPGLSAQAFDHHLGAVNHEYAAKRRSGRLSPPEIAVMSYPALMARLMADPRYEHTSPLQFKLLPLYQMFWEELATAPITGGL